MLTEAVTTGKMRQGSDVDRQGPDAGEFLLNIRNPELLSAHFDSFQPVCRQIRLK